MNTPPDSAPEGALEEFPSEHPQDVASRPPQPAKDAPKSRTWWRCAIVVVDTLIPVGLVLMAVYFAFS